MFEKPKKGNFSFGYLICLEETFLQKERERTAGKSCLQTCLHSFKFLIFNAIIQCCYTRYWQQQRKKKFPRSSAALVISDKDQDIASARKMRNFNTFGC
jgi:hypothetical protein